MKKQLHHFYKKYFYPIFGVGILTLIVALAYFINYRTQPSFNSISIFQDSEQIDTTIHPVSIGKYRYQNKNPLHQTSFRKNPTESAAIHFSNQYSDLSFFTNSTQSFAKANPEVEPITEGSTITYPAIFPNTDLRYTVEPDRLLEEFVVHNQDTALTMTEITQTLDRREIDSYEEVAGAIKLYKDERLVATVPKPVMYENGDQTKRSYDLSYSIKKLNNNTLTITKVVDAKGQAWLSDPTRTYPIAIDLVIDNADTAASWVSSDTTSTVVTQETTIKQEGTGSVKVATAGESNTTADLMEYSSNANAQAAYITNGAGIIATGGTITYSGGYTIHIFTSSGNFTITSGSGNVEALVVAGGGAGTGYGGGGGGAGGVLNNTSVPVSSGNYPVTVGNGGTANCYTCQNTAGGNSIFSTLTAIGGGVTNFHASGGAGGSGSGGMYVTSGNVPLPGGAGTAGQGNNGGTGGGVYVSYVIGGGGGGKAGAGGNAVYNGSVGGAGGAGQSYSTSGSPTLYGGGGGGGGSSSGGAGGSGGGGNGGGPGVSGIAGIANTGGGGGGGGWNTGIGGAGGSGIVIIRYPTPTGSNHTQGSYSLKGIATTTAINKTLTRTVSPTLNLAGHDTINFDIRSSRTGSNIKIGIHDSGGTTTEITPNITSANVFQAKSWDISGVSDANKDAIDKIIITIVNASAANTFYIDDMTATGRSINDTVTLTRSALDLSSAPNLTYWVRSDTTGSFARFEFGESTSSEQTNAFTINSANTWEKKTWDISGITGTSRDAVTKFAVKFTSDTSGAILYFDDANYNGPPNTPSLDLPTDTATNQSLLPVIKTTGTDTESDYLRYKIELCEDVGMSVSCQTFDQTSSQTGWSGQDAQTSTAYASGTQATYTLQSALAANDTFYWRSYAIDPGGTNTWSSTQGTPYSFSTTTAPTAPTTPYTEGSTNPANVIDLTPEFSAVHNDGDGDSANYYQIVVDTQVGFDGVEMWDSGKISMTTTANGVRSPDISYAGSALSLDDTTYYWHIKFWDTLGAEGTYSATANFGMNIKPTTPSLDLPTDTATNQSLLPVMKTTTTDADSDYIRYKVQICTDLAMTTGCNTYDQTSSQTGWSGQDAQTSTAYASGTQATYTLQSVLAINTTYYWRSYAIDPGGANSWSATQTPYSFTTTDTPVQQTDCRVQESRDDTSLTVIWTDTATNEDGYEVQRSADAAAFSVLVTGLAANSISHQDSTIATGHTYRYRVAPYLTAGPTYGDWCYTNTLSISSGNFTFENINFE